MNHLLGWTRFSTVSINKLISASLVAIVLALTGCGGGGDDKPKEQDPPRTVSGSGVKGPLISAIVTVYAIDYSASDFKGAVIASGTTDNAAQITDVALPLPLTPPYLMEISSDADTIDITTLTDPTDLTTGSAPVISTLRTIITNDMLSSGIDLYATPQTTIATDIALMGKTDNASMLAALPDAASVVMSALGFGASASIDIFNTPPLINAATDTPAEQTEVAEYRLAIEALTAVVFNAANAVGGTTTPDSLLADLISDLADGVIDTLDPAAIAALTADPTTLTIPNTSKSLVTDITTTLVEEKATTGSTTPTPELEPSGSISPAPLPAETDTDIDGDTFLNIEDNCPTVSNDQTDVNSNGMGDACEPAIIVPDVVGQTQATAESTIISAGLTVGVITNSFSNTVAAGNVISQTPPSGSDSLESLPVDLVISDGPAPVDVPNVVGMTNTAATSALEALGLVVIENRINDAAAIDEVIAQDPAATTTVAVGSTITLTVSDGPVVEPLPSVVGMSVTAAKSTLEALGFVVVEVRINDEAPVDQVISQDPAATTSVVIGSTVTITISDGPVMVDVPNVVGMSNTAATAALETLGLVVVENRVNNAAAIDEVISQDPTATTTVAVGSTVTITVSDGPVMVDVPNVIGMTNTAAISALETLGLVVVENRVNDAAAIDEVIGQDPTATTSVAVGSTVTITVSNGTPLPIDVPNVVGMTNTAATAALETLGLVVVENRVSDTAAIDEVIAQDPAATTSVAIGSTVTITVSDGPASSDVSGIWQLQNTVVGGGCSTGIGDPGYLLADSGLIRYISITQPTGSSAITITYHNGIAATGSLVSDSIVLTSGGSRAWTDSHGYATSISFSLTGDYIPASNTIVGTIIHSTTNADASCSQEFTFTAEHIGTPPSNLAAYSGVLDTEMVIDKDSGFTNREYGSGHALFTDSTVTFAYIDGEYGENTTAFSYDPATGIATSNSTYDSIIDFDGDGADDLEHETINTYVMFVRDPSDTSGAQIAWTEFTARQKFIDTTIYNPGLTPAYSENGTQRSYGRLSNTQGYIRSNFRPYSGGTLEGNFYHIGVLNPPMAGLDNGINTEIDVVDNTSTSVICTTTYNARVRGQTQLPLPNMTVEEFGQFSYSFISCPIADTTPIIDGGSYTINIKDSTGTPVYSYTFNATPTTFPTALPSRRQLDLNGAQSSRTERGNVIDLYGFFNPQASLPIIVPASTDPDLEYYRLRFQDAFGGNVNSAIMASTTNSFTLTPDDLNVFQKQGGTNLLRLRLEERYNRTGGAKAQSFSRWLYLWAGLRGLINFEMVNDTTTEWLTFQMYVEAEHGFTTASCTGTHALEVTLCDGGTSTVDYSTNTLTVPITLSSGVTRTLTVTFTDSVNATASISDGASTWNGSARIVSPELVVRSQIDSSAAVRTDIIMTNPYPGDFYQNALLSSASGQDLGNGTSTPIQLWNADYLTTYRSFFQTPFDGIYPQKTAGFVAYNSASIGLLTADSFTYSLDIGGGGGGTLHRVNYNGADPSSMLAPTRTGNPGGTVITVNGSTATGFGSPTELTSLPIIITWPHTPTAAPADTRWQIRLRQVGSSGSDHLPHFEVRSERLADGEQNLSYDSASNTWTWAANFIVPSTGIWKFNLRASDPDNTIRGISQGFFVTDTTP